MKTSVCGDNRAEGVFNDVTNMYKSGIGDAS